MLRRAGDRRIAGLVVYLHYAHAMGMERLAMLMDEFFSLSIRQGAINCQICRRMRRYPVQHAIPAAVAAGDSDRTTTRDAEGHHPEAISCRPRPTARSDHRRRAGGRSGTQIYKRMLANRMHLFVSVTNQAVPYTNNTSERDLLLGVIFRKVTNGFRSEWGAETYAAFRSVISTAKANRASILDTIRFVLAAKLPAGPIAGVGSAITISAHLDTISLAF